MKVDHAGQPVRHRPRRRPVFTPTAEHLGTLATGEATANCGFGDDGTTLYITADMYLCRIRLTTKGF